MTRRQFRVFSKIVSNKQEGKPIKVLGFDISFLDVIEVSPDVVDKTIKPKIDFLIKHIEEHNLKQFYYPEKYSSLGVVSFTLWESLARSFIWNVMPEFNKNLIVGYGKKGCIFNFFWIDNRNQELWDKYFSEKIKCLFLEWLNKLEYK